MGRYDDFDPMDLDPATGRPYSNYSSPALDTSFHDGEMDVDLDESPLAALKAAERFVAGFEGDEMQEGVDELLAQMRAAIQKGSN